MSTPTAHQETSVSQRLRTVKNVLQDAVDNPLIASATPGEVEFDDLKRDALKVLHLVGFLGYKLAPISRIPPEILALLPDFWDAPFRDRDVISLTHVCRTWREIFISRSSLWSKVDCVDTDKARVYFDRSGTSPIDVRLRGATNPLSLGLFLQIAPQAVGRLRSLSVYATPQHLRTITACLFRPAPLLASLEITGGCHFRSSTNEKLTSRMFNGDLSSLRELSLGRVRTGLPWRGMTNLTSFTLYAIDPDYLTIGQFLDFLESAPSLRKIDLRSVALAPEGGNGRLVSPGHLQKVDIIRCTPISTLLDHLVIPVGVKLTTLPNESGFDVDDNLPSSLNNLRNLSGFNKVYLRLQDGTDDITSLDTEARIELKGPNGGFCMLVVSSLPDFDPASEIFESLARFDTSRVEQLHTEYDIPPYRDTHQALLPMRSLRTLVVSRCPYRSLSTFMEVLNPDVFPAMEVVCPLLERLILVIFDKDFDVRSVSEMAAARASMGAKLKSLVIVGDWVQNSKGGMADMSQLRKHVLNVECCSKIPVDDGETKPSDEED